MSGDTRTGPDVICIFIIQQLKRLTALSISSLSVRALRLSWIKTAALCASDRDDIVSERAT